ncbi:MAG: hypothetical protein WC373_09880 [Smithella sp.]|jgi:spore coat protein U-like protein
MKKLMVVLAAMMMVIAMVAGAYAATVAPEVDVTATVTKKCSATKVDGTITFDIDPELPGPITANTTNDGAPPSVKCTAGTTYAVACTSNNGGTLNGTDNIPYTITGCATPITGGGFGAGADVEIPVGVSIDNAAYANAEVGAHTDTILVTVTY